MLAKTMWFSALVSIYDERRYYVIQWIHGLQLANVEFEMDSKKVVDYFKDDSGDLNEFGVTMAVFNYVIHTSLPSFL